MENDLAAQAIELAKDALLNYLNAQWGIEEAPNLDSARILYTPELEGSPFLDQVVTDWYEANAETVFDEWCSTRKHGNGRGQCGCKRHELIAL